MMTARVQTDENDDAGVRPVMTVTSEDESLNMSVDLQSSGAADFPRRVVSYLAHRLTTSVRQGERASPWTYCEVCVAQIHVAPMRDKVRAEDSRSSNRRKQYTWESRPVMMALHCTAGAPKWSDGAAKRG